MKKRAKATMSFVKNSKNVIFVILLIAAAITVYGIANAATVSHRGADIQPPIDATKLNGLSAAEIIAAGTISSGAILPACDSSKRGKLFSFQGGSGVEDGLYVCKKKADNAYGWNALASPTDVIACAKLNTPSANSYLPASFPNLKRFFVSSGMYYGDLREGGSTGLGGADIKCQREANNKGYGGTWKALLGDTRTRGIDRVNDAIFVSAEVVMSGQTACYELYAQNLTQLINGPSCSFTKNVLGLNYPIWAQSLKVITSAQCREGCYNNYYYLNACKDWTYAGNEPEYTCYVPALSENVILPALGAVQVPSADQCFIWGYGPGASLEGGWYCAMANPNSRQSHPTCGQSAHLYCVEQ